MPIPNSRAQCAKSKNKGYYEAFRLVLENLAKADRAANGHPPTERAAVRRCFKNECHGRVSRICEFEKRNTRRRNGILPKSARSNAKVGFITKHHPKQHKSGIITKYCPERHKGWHYHKADCDEQAPCARAPTNKRTTAAVTDGTTGYVDLKNGIREDVRAYCQSPPGAMQKWDLSQSTALSSIKAGFITKHHPEQHKSRNYHIILPGATQRLVLSQSRLRRTSASALRHRAREHRRTSVPPRRRQAFQPAFPKACGSFSHCSYMRSANTAKPHFGSSTRTWVTAPTSLPF